MTKKWCPGYYRGGSMNRYKIIILNVLIFILPALSASHLRAGKAAVFDSIFRPDMVAVSDKYIYISERASIHIYSLENVKPVKVFGKEGEGPGEFKINPYAASLVMIPHGDRLVINSMAKVSIYTARGDFVKEFRVPPNQIYIPFGDAYVYTDTAVTKDEKLVTAVNLSDKKLQKVTRLYLSDFEVGASMRFNFPVNSFAFVPQGENIYVAAGKEGFVIDVFDKTGKKLYRVKKQYKPLKIPADYKTKSLNWFKTHPNWKNLYSMFKDRISFKSHYPPIFRMFSDKSRLYLLTYKMKGQNRECIILDFKGNEIKRVFLPVPEAYGFDFLPKYTFHNRIFYILKENEDQEVFELHKINVK